MRFDFIKVNVMKSKKKGSTFPVYCLNGSLLKAVSFNHQVASCWIYSNSPIW